MAAAQPSPEHARYTALWIPPAGALSHDVEIYTGDDENAAIAAAVEYDAPAAGRVEIRHYTPAGTLIGTRLVEHGDTGAEIVDHFDQAPELANVEPRRQNVETDEPDREIEPREIDPDEQLEESPDADRVGPRTDPPAPEEDEEQTTRDLNAAADELEHDLDQEHDEAEQAESLFDPADYETEELALPTVDGISVAKIGLNVQGGMLWLDRGSAEDVSLVRDLRVGQRVRLLVDVTVGVPKFGYTTNREGALDVLYRARNVKVKHAVLSVGQPDGDEEQ